jgi:ABC-type branched-subunit amino acid transport system ATPase component
MRPWQKDPLLKVEHLTMRFGGLVAVGGRLVKEASA